MSKFKAIAALLITVSQIVGCDIIRRGVGKAYTQSLETIAISRACDISAVPFATVRLKLDNKFEIGSIQRHVEYFSGKKLDGDAIDTGANNLPEKTGNPLHIDRRAFKDHASGWVLVRIVLLDNNLDFDAIATPPSPIQGVGLGDDATDSDYCALPISKSDENIPADSSRPAQVASFMFKVPFGGSSKQGFNVVLVPTTAKETPIIIDPKIQNNG